MDAVSRFLERRDAMLLRLDEQLLPATTPAEAAHLLCDYIGRELNLADCVVYFPAGNVLVQVASWGSRRSAGHLLETRLQRPVDRGLPGQCARELQAQRVQDTRLDPRCAADDPGSLSELAVPIRHEDVLLGILDSESPEAEFYDARYEAAFLAIADCGARRLWQLNGHAVRR
ncbi:GAF domain-containing protein [Lysobacter solisilvae (ex Woo and Kim 2020)]|uniref:GAF domain-containing protein n=1 Tax=Agrilutibacter terrestris TaxID=2865112 RepID=A0A7H0FVD2_9GAMM|nr:GAF domain-containing protein [Lysobacter terrestris]QNP39998.1 GAF domain-containing protein [Lysobacter terrestris]